MAKYGATDDYVPLDNMTERTPLSQTSGGTGTVHIIKEELAEAFDPQKFEKIIPLWADWDDMRVHWRRLARELFAEWFGTMLFVFLGVGSVAASAPFEGRMSSATVVVIALGFGFGITTMIYATANISGVSHKLISLN